MNNTYSLTQSTDELKKLIQENPDLPIVVLAGEDACGGGYSYCWTYCSNISFHLDEILDCDFYDYDDTVFTDRDRLEEKIEDDLWDEYHESQKKNMMQRLKISWQNLNLIGRR